ncbi:hypothetical protein [Flammeovirga aprica]|uniref:Uncharacterized protein n=1 Tax=Flammeovirga aprica JL-4 TaxID=694437 RepID=A0A7X9XCE7_9BACT|nr:hypothetical protein [Flammeovirga aprica]NME71727.1 hypothetical protein [Flammeovirga aprica JL-4]
MMNNKLWIAIIGLWCIPIFPLLGQEKVLIFEGDFDLKGGYESFTYKFIKGDQIVFSFEKENKKPMKKVWITGPKSRTLFQRMKSGYVKDRVIKVTSTGKYYFKFEDRASGKNIHIKIERIPAEGSEKLIASGQPYKRGYWLNSYDTVDYNYEIDSVVGYGETEEFEREFKLFNEYVYQTVPMLNASGQLLGRLGKGNKHTKLWTCQDPKPPFGADDAKLLYIQYNINSKLGSAKHWKMVQIGGTVTSLALSVFASPAAGFASQQALDMMMPEENGEPTMYFFSKNESSFGEIKKLFTIDFDLFKSGGKNVNFDGVRGLGSVTNLYGVMLPEMYSELELKHIILANTKPATAKNVKLDFSALYYAPVYVEFKATERFVPLKTVKVQRTIKKVVKKRKFIEL